MSVLQRCALRESRLYIENLLPTAKCTGSTPQLSTTEETSTLAFMRKTSTTFFHNDITLWIDNKVKDNSVTKRQITGSGRFGKINGYTSTKYTEQDKQDQLSLALGFIIHRRHRHIGKNSIHLNLLQQEIKRARHSPSVRFLLCDQLCEHNRLGFLECCTTLYTKKCGGNLM